MRLKIIRIAFTVLFVIVASGLFYIQVLKSQHFFFLSKNNRIRIVKLEGRRGKVYDRNGVELIGNRVSLDLFVIPQEISDQEKLFSYLSSILRRDKEAIEKDYLRGRLAPFTPVVIAEDLSREIAYQIEENKFLYPGLMVQASSRRYYPHHEVGAHVLGYVAKVDRQRLKELKEYGYTYQSLAGYSGIEEYYDTYLTGEDGGQQVEVNSRGEQVRLLGIRRPVSGQDLTLTLDQRIQNVAKDALNDRKGSIVIMDLESGGILAMVNNPSYDPNHFVSENTKKQVARYFIDPQAPLLNRAIAGQYPPGSTFKIPVAFGGLQQGVIVNDTTFRCPGYFKLGRRRFRCSHAHGIQNLTEAIAHSCNTYFFNVGLLLGPDLIHRYADLFGMGELTGIDLPSEKKGINPSPEQKRIMRNDAWYDGDTLNLSIGQGDVLVSPLQLIRMMAIVARDGRDIYPHLIRSIGAIDVSSDRFTQRVRVPINAQYFEFVQKGLKGAVGDYTGTARDLKIKDFPMAGKTGTAQTSGGQNNHSWFAGYTIEGERRVVFVVFLEFGGSSYYAVRTSRKMIEQLIHKGLL